MHGDPQGMAGDGERRTQVVVAITLVMMVVEIVTGSLTSSVALLADGWHMGTHAAALGITLYAYHFTRTHPDIEVGSPQASRASALGGFASAIVLGIVALYIGYEAFRHFVERPEISYGQALPVAVIGLFVNGWCAWILGQGHEGGGHPHGHAHDQLRPQRQPARRWSAGARQPHLDAGRRRIPVHQRRHRPSSSSSRGSSGSSPTRRISRT